MEAPTGALVERRILRPRATAVRYWCDERPDPGNTASSLAENGHHSCRSRAAASSGATCFAGTPAPSGRRTGTRVPHRDQRSRSNGLLRFSRRTSPREWCSWERTPCYLQIWSTALRLSNVSARCVLPRYGKSTIDARGDFSRSTTVARSTVATDSFSYLSALTMQCASPERQHTKGLDDGESFHNVLRESLL